MKEGEKCIVYLTPENAYGARGAPPDIPPNMPLVRALRVQTQTVRHIRGRIDAREILACMRLEVDPPFRSSRSLS